MTSAGEKREDSSPLPLEQRVRREGEPSAARSEVALLEADLRSARSEIVLANASALDHQQKLQAATLQCQTQAALLRQRLTATARVTRQLLTANQDRVRCEQELLRLRQDLLSANQDLLGARQELLTTNEELLAANRDKKRLERELGVILESRSWRLTAPIRFTVTKLKGWIASVRHRRRSTDG